MQKAWMLFTKNRMLQNVILLFLLLTITWLFIKPFEPEELVTIKSIWSSMCLFLSALGSFYGFRISREWGGKESIVGRMVLSFSLGLLLQTFGQIAYGYYLWFTDIEVPYPSIGDIGYFGSIFPYIYGSYLLARYIGINVAIRSFLVKTITIIIPIGMFATSYYFFLDGYNFDFGKLKTFLDFGYPIGQAVYVSFALLILALSQNSFGGSFRRPVIFLVIALITQYIADSCFLYQSMQGVWYYGGFGDFLYCLAYFAMAMTLVYLGYALEKIKIENEQKETNIQFTKEDNASIFNKILTEIIKRQVNIMGDMAWAEVRKIPDILIHDEKMFKISIGNNPKGAIDSLVHKYQKVFGDLAVVVSKNAVYNLLSSLSYEEMPDSLK